MSLTILALYGGHSGERREGGHKSCPLEGVGGGTQGQQLPTAAGTATDAPSFSFHVSQNGYVVLIFTISLFLLT